MTEHLMARSRTTIVLVAGAVAAWAVTADRMRGMDAGPGTDLGGLGWYLGVWVTMTAAMMLPSAVPAARHVARLACRLPTLLFTAGQVPYDAEGGVKHRGDFKAQARAVFAAIKALVEAGGGTLDSVVKITTYVTDVRYRLDFRSVREEFFGAKGPASTMVEVSSLAHPDYLIVEAIAVI